MPDAKPAETPAPEGGGGNQPGNRVDPFRGYNFMLKIDGVNEAHFTQCTGIGIKVSPIRFREGGESKIVHVLPGPLEYAEVTLKYGLTQSPELWTWFNSALQGTPERKNVSVIMLGPSGKGEGLRWDLIDAWPSEWRGAPLDALGMEIAIESLTLVYESVGRG